MTLLSRAKGMQRKKHSREEIAELHERGKTQAEIARTLGVSAMTYHRWRKARSQPGLNGNCVPDFPQSAVEELHKENRRLRQLLTDLSLEKLKLQENSPRAATAVPAQPDQGPQSQAIGELPPSSAVTGLSDPRKYGASGIPSGDSGAAKSNSPLSAPSLHS